ncbi:MAG TPA: hypothetical protein VEL07_02180 [Planctomycetota bacterium]|nr:hypothetical protein [Planctomycetota bacterium]
MSHALPMLMISWSALAAAAEPTIADLRLIGGIGHGDSRIDGRTRPGTGGPSGEALDAQGDHDEREHAAFQALTSGRALGAYGGPLIGIELGWRTCESDLPLDAAAGELDVDSRAWTCDLMLGWAHALSSRWHVEATGFVGLGRLELDFGYAAQSGSYHGDDRGMLTEYGARVGGYWTVGRFQIGAEARWLVERASSSIGLDVGTPEATAITDLEQRGLFLMLALGYRL